MNNLAMQIINELEEWASKTPEIGETTTERQKGWRDGNLAFKRQLISKLSKFKRAAQQNITGVLSMEYTIQEIQAMLNIVSALLKNRRFQQGNALRISTVYNIDDFDIATMEKWIAYWKKTIDATKPTKTK